MRPGKRHFQLLISMLSILHLGTCPSPATAADMVASHIGPAQTQAIDTLEVPDTNPLPEVVRGRLPCIELQVIAYKESRFRQFDPAGRPLFGAPSGVGIMQLERPYRKDRDLWDWRANVDTGVALFERKQIELRRHFAMVRKANPEAPELTPEQYKLAKYQYYNGGFYFRWNRRLARWEKYGVTSYADDALRIERLVSSGTPPVDWDRPAIPSGNATARRPHPLLTAMEPSQSVRKE